MSWCLQPKWLSAPSFRSYALHVAYPWRDPRSLLDGVRSSDAVSVDLSDPLPIAREKGNAAAPLYAGKLHLFL